MLALLTMWIAPPYSALAGETGEGNLDEVSIRAFQPEKPLSRARRLTPLVAIVENNTEAAIRVTPILEYPSGVKLLHPDSKPIRLPAGGRMTSRTLTWNVKAKCAMQADLRLKLISGDRLYTSSTLSISFLPPVRVHKKSYVPEPRPVKTDILIGAINCPLWEKDDSWNFLAKHPERTPALGRYDQSKPEVADWETKWAVEHGINFFVYCWYRASKGDAVETVYSSAIDALIKSKYADKFKFAIMWENQWRWWGMAGTRSEKDLLQNLMPFWMEHYFKQPIYLKIDNKPLLFVYDSEQLTKELGSAENVHAAFDKMREACKREGFAGLTILGECRGLNPVQLKLRKAMGFDYLFPYVWPVPEPARAVDRQIEMMQMVQAHGILPWIDTVSQGWSGWDDKPEKYIYTLSPAKYETLLRKAKDFLATRPAGDLGSKMLLLDNWNEWGEGHYIAPYRQYGFGYLDVVRRVFSTAKEKHVDLIPDDIVLGPYGSASAATGD